MGLLGSLLTSGLYIVNPMLGLAATVVNYVVDERSSGASALLSAAGGLIGGLGPHAGGCAPLAHAGPGSLVGDPFLCHGLELATSTATDLVLDALLQKHEHGTVRCSTPGCGRQDVIKAVTRDGHPACRACYERMAGGVVLVDGSRFEPERFHGEHTLVVLPDRGRQVHRAVSCHRDLNKEELRVLLSPPQHRPLCEQLLRLRSGSKAARERLSRLANTPAPPGGLAEWLQVWMGPIDQPSPTQRYRGATCDAEHALRDWVASVNAAIREVAQLDSKSADSAGSLAGRLPKPEDVRDPAWRSLLEEVPAKLESVAQAAGIRF